MAFQTIGAKEVEACLHRPDTRLIDMRTREEYEQYHLEGAENVPAGEFYDYMETQPKSSTYILYCQRGGSSLMAAKELGRAGYNVYTVIGGIHAFKEWRLN